MDEVEDISAEVPQTTVATPTAEEPKGDQDVKPESSTGAADAAPEGPPKKKSGGFQKRIDKLTRTVYELEAKLQAKEQQDAPKPEVEPARESFETIEDYQRALSEFTAKRVIGEFRAKEELTRRELEARTETERRRSTWESHVEKASEKYDDGEDMMSHFMSEITLAPAALEGILESEVGDDIAYHLAKNEAEYDRIRKLSPARQAIEIGKLEVKLQTPKSAPRAPAPIETVKTSSRVADGEYHSDMSDEEYDKYRQRRKGRI